MRSSRAPGVSARLSLEPGEDGLFIDSPSTPAA
jgi:hypothetical protein